MQLYLALIHVRCWTRNRHAVDCIQLLLVDPQSMLGPLQSGAFVRANTSSNLQQAQ